MQYVSVHTLVAGKLMNGFFVTITQIAALKMINETVPVKVIGKFGSIFSIMMTTGYMLVFISGLGLPPLDYNPAEPDTGLNLAAKQ